VEHDDRPTLLVESPHHGVDERPFRDRVGEVGQGRFDEFDDLDLDRPPSPAARQVEARIDGQATDPGIEAFWVAEASQVTPGPEQRLLDGIARELAVAEDQTGSRVQPRDGPANELGEGVMIALPGPLHELSLVHGHLTGRSDLAGRLYWL
jgi:hypothetical protein